MHQSSLTRRNTSHAFSKRPRHDCATGLCTGFCPRCQLAPLSVPNLATALRHETIDRCPADFELPRDLCCPEATGLEPLDLAHIDARLATLVDARRPRLRGALTV